MCMFTVKLYEHAHCHCKIARGIVNKNLCERAAELVVSWKMKTGIDLEDREPCPAAETLVDYILEIQIFIQMLY